MSLLRHLFRLSVLFVCICARPAFAAEPAVLIADRMFIRPDGVLVADGNVEAHQGDLQLSATQVIFSGDSNTLEIKGPIKLQDGDGIVIFADEAKLDPQLIDGLLIGARLVLNQQLQLAAVELNRTEGRYTQLYKTVATSCRICGDNTPPIWQIRAEKVIHDSVEKQLYFENAQFHVLDVPLVSIPRLRMPDPTQDRSTGFLVPTGRSSSLLGIGIKLPYFVTLGDHRDLTLTPYLSDQTKTLEWRYRQAFAKGDFTATGGISDDSMSETVRAYAFVDGRTSLASGYELSYDIELTSDPSYLLDYGYSGKDRLDSAISINRVDHGEYFIGDVIHFRTLRDSETNDTQPTLIAETTYERRLDGGPFGGDLTLTAEASGHLRTSQVDIIGRDIARARASAEWLRSDIFDRGLLVESHALLQVSSASIAQDSSSDDFVFNVNPALYANFRWPLSARTEKASYLLEPVLQIAWSDSVNEIPNEESTLVEFDEANLLDFSRFPASDRVEEGIRLAYGGNWTRYDPTGATTRLSVGRVLRDTADPDHTKSSGLQGQLSDWMVAGQVSTESGFELISRALFDKDADFSKAESRMTWQRDWGSISATHIWLAEDTAEDRDDPLSEINLSTRVNLARHWVGQVDWQYDLAAQRIVKAGIGAEYQNECLDVRLSASRRFTSSTTVDPSTDYDFTIGLRGFGAGRSGADGIRNCGN
ncbi:MAG: LPS assembly protein LptD [Paracoccaceae bacterium]|nr:LPS assembly protein LptD [Paracoccaceae bacterium]